MSGEWYSNAGPAAWNDPSVRAAMDAEYQWNKQREEEEITRMRQQTSSNVDFVTGVVFVVLLLIGAAVYAVVWH